MNIKNTCAVVIFLIAFAGVAGQLSAQTKANNLTLTLDQVIELAVNNSRAIHEYKLSYKYNRASVNYERRKYEPVISLGTGTNFEHDYSKNGEMFSRINSTMTGLNANISMLLPTGAKIAYDWEGGYLNEAKNYSTSGKATDDHLSQGGTLSVTQPLLRGAWFSVNNASVDIAAYSDSTNYQLLRNNVSGIIVSVIYAYRNILLNERVRDIAENSLILSKELLEMNKALVTTGIIAETDLVQNESQVTSARYQVMNAENNLHSAKLALNDLLDINIDEIIIPAELNTDYNFVIDSAKIFDDVFKSNTSYLTAEYNLKIAKLNMMLAENNKELDLSLFSQYRNSSKSLSPYMLNNNFKVGVNLSYSLNDRSRDQLYQQAVINVERARNNLKLIRNEIEIKLNEKLRELKLKKETVEIAKKIKDYACQKLEVEKEKMKIGKSATFTLVTFQNDLVNAENNEINSIVGYLNAVTSLRYFTGNILDVYNINM